MLVETRGHCNPVKSADNVYSELDNKLIYVSGKLATNGLVVDSHYGISGELLKRSVACRIIATITFFLGRFVRLKRKVEMYQWIEETETRCGVAWSSPGTSQDVQDCH